MHRSPSPFHAGEADAQRRAGVSDVAQQRGRSIRDSMPDQHRAFFAQLPFIVLGGIDERGQPWPSLRVGAPGFVSSPDARTLRIAGAPLPGDPLHDAWRPGALAGGLGIELPTRRRNRVNGVVTSIDRGVLALSVEQSFGNCPQYIQSRTPVPVEPAARAASVTCATGLDDADRALLSHADTFFIATGATAESAAAARGLDVSHRGGPPGFVRVDGPHQLTVPDYSGNHFFNTIGNLLVEPRAGLLFIDFASGDLLYVAARAEVLWDSPDARTFRGARRLVRFHLHEVRRAARALPFRWSAVQYSPKFRTDW